MRRRLKKEWSCGCAELHDACLSLGCSVPDKASMLGYFGVLSQALADANTSFLPQRSRTHTKKALQEVLRCLRRGRKTLGGLGGNKKVLAERLATLIQAVVGAGAEADDAEVMEDAAFDEEGMDFAGPGGAAPERKRPYLATLPSYPAEMPSDAYVTAAQAESSLGKHLADELDEAEEELGDKDLIVEAQALAGMRVNPPGVDYACVALDLASLTPEELERIGNPPVETLTRGRLEVSPEVVKKELEEAVEDRAASLEKELMGASGAEKLRNAVATLDPTQRRVFDTLDEWASAKVARKDPERPVRLLVLGTAGSGKTWTIQAAVLQVRRKFRCFDSVLMVSHTGVAAVNMGAGASTIDSAFKLGGGKLEDLEGERLDEFITAMEKVELVVIDEISTVGAAQFEMISRRLEQLGKVRHRRRRGGAAPETLGGFGGLSVLCVGDFGQLPPVLSVSLIARRLAGSQGHGVAQARALQGQRRFNAFDDVVCLRRVYRQKDGGAYRDSALRMRDAAMTLEDLELWREHALQRPDDVPEWDGSEGMGDYAVQLVMENEICGSVNGARLLSGRGCIGARTATGGDVPTTRTDVARTASGGDVPATRTDAGAVFRARAWHSQGNGPTKKSDVFRGLRSCFHFKIGSPVMYTQNSLAGANVVPLGVMNGARGYVVAALYSAPGVGRLDGEELGQDASELALPEIVVVHFPTYTGPELYPGLPSTWVPVFCSRSVAAAAGVRLGVPLRLCSALTVHKSQGLTLVDGAVLDFRVGGGSTRNPVSTSGLGFVGSTRVQGFEKQAFYGLPPIEGFLEMRQSTDFKNRELFEESAATRHEEFLTRRWKKTLEDEVQDHIDAEVRKLGRALSQAEETDLRSMLLRRGVAPVAADVQVYLKQSYGPGVTLQEVSRSFKRKGGEALKEGLAAGKRKEPAKGSKRSFPQGVNAMLRAAREVRVGMLEDMGFERDVALLGLEACDEDVSRAAEWCALLNEHAGEGVQAAGESGEARVWQTLADAGFDLAAALLHAGGRVPGASEMSMLKRQLGTEWWQGHVAAGRRRGAAKKIASTLEPGAETHAEYVRRATAEYPGRVWTVRDLGVYAGEGTNACFWLSVVAGWSRCRRRGDLRPAVAALREEVEVLTGVTGEELARRRTRKSRDDAVGLAADRLRELVCGPESGFMREQEQEAVFAQAHAATTCVARSMGDVGPLEAYRRWLRRVRADEFADELVLTATARLLGVCIVVVPSRPGWVVRAHPVEDAWVRLGVDTRDVMVLGNNDAHYVWLEGSES